MINEYLSQGKALEDEAVHLLFSMNRWEAKRDILDSLSSGETIICD
jgi:dTMP kinase